MFGQLVRCCAQCPCPGRSDAGLAFSFERGADDTFVTLGHWDSLRKGLLAGERLQSELRRMELAWLDRNRREHELTKHISLAALAPAKLLELKLTGKCDVSLPESLFDRDYPGHYHRRVKSVSLSIPAVAGPYSGVHCRLALTASRVRKNDSLAAGAYLEATEGDGRFVTFRTATTSIATSSGQNDSGVFQLDFRDERYLPFEGAGAISTWHIELPQANNDFDLQTVSDVVLHLSYTAREGTTTFRTQAGASLALLPEGERTFARAFSVRHDMPDAWHAYATAPTGAPRAIALGRVVERLGFVPPGQRPLLVSVSALALGVPVPTTSAPSLTTEPVAWPTALTASFVATTSVPPAEATRTEATFAFTDPGTSFDVRGSSFTINNIELTTPEDVIVIVTFQRVAP